MKIILVRHAEPRRGTGEKAREDYGLTEKGQQQTRALVSTLTFPIDHIVTSSLPRAIETGAIIAGSFPRIKPEINENFCEIGERHRLEPEPLPTFFKRVEAVMNLLADEGPGKTTLVVTHAGFIMGSIRALFNIPTPGTGARLEPKFTSLTQWTKQDGIWELSYFNLHGAD